MSYKPEYKPCHDPENCNELHNEQPWMDENPHHYGCECEQCMMFYWHLKH